MTDKTVLIHVPTAEYARKAEFYDLFDMMDKPMGTAICRIHGQSPARNRNLAIRQALELNVSHIMFMDDDVSPKKDTLTNLMKYDVDIISGLYLMRSYPHQPIIFDRADADGRCAFHFLNDNEYNHSLVPIVSCGLGCVLINMNVFKALEEPWVRLGEIEKDHWCDDVGLWRRARAAGFSLFCDLTNIVGHNASITVYPEYRDGKWVTCYNSFGTGIVSFPAIRY